MTLLRGCVLQVLSFDDCVEKIESVGNTTRIQSVLETLRAEESKKYTPTDEMEVEESAARNLSEELDDELPDHPDTSAKTTGTDAVGAGSEMPQSAADEMEEDEDTLMPDDMEEEELDAGFEYAGMEDDEDMDGHTPSVAAQPSVGKAPAPPSSTAAPAMKELSEEQKERIQRNKQAALLRLKERETAKALQAATSKDANEPATPAPGSSPAPSAGASRRASRAGSPRRSSSRAPASVVVRYMTPSMERLAATKAKNASASPSSAPPAASAEAVQNTASSGPALAQGAVADNFSRSDESQRRPMPGEVIEVAKGHRQGRRRRRLDARISRGQLSARSGSAWCQHPGLRNRCLFRQVCCTCSRDGGTGSKPLQPGAHYSKQVAWGAITGVANSPGTAG